MPPIRLRAPWSSSHRSRSTPALAERDGQFGIVADAALPARLGLKVGDTVAIGTGSFVLRAILASEPDKLAGGISLGPAGDDVASRTAAVRVCCSRVRSSAGRRGLLLPTASGAPISDAALARFVDRGQGCQPDRRLGRAHAQRRVARVRPQPRALYPIPDPGRPDGTDRRRRRGRQCGAGDGRPQADQPRHPEGARRRRRDSLRHQPRRGAGRRDAGHPGGPAGRCRVAVHRRRRLRRADPVSDGRDDRSRRRSRSARCTGC